MKKLIEAPDLTKKRKLKIAPSLVPTPEEPLPDTENIKKLQEAITKITNTLNDVLSKLKKTDSKVKEISGIQDDLLSIQDKIKGFSEKMAKGESVEKDVKELTFNLSLLTIRVEKLEKDTTVTDIKEDLKTIHKTLEFFKDLMDSLYSRTSYYGGGGGENPATTVVSETSFDASPVVGVSTKYAREDHTHGTPATPTGMVMKADYDAQSILAATLDDTPVALTVAEQTIVGRITGGNIAALTPTQIATMLSLGCLGATCWVVANDAQAQEKAFATLLQASGYPVWVCDGVNDEVEIQAAIDAAGGGEVKLSEGSFLIEYHLNLVSNQTLRGCGRSTILTTNVSIMMLVALGGSGTKLTGITIADLQLDGGAGLVGDVGIYFEYVDNSLIQNVYSRRHSARGFHIESSDNNHIVNNSCNDNGNDGIYLAACDYNTIIGNHCIGNTVYGININDATCDQNIVSGNQLLGNTGGALVDNGTGTEIGHNITE